MSRCSAASSIRVIHELVKRPKSIDELQHWWMDRGGPGSRPATQSNHSSLVVRVSSSSRSLPNSAMRGRGQRNKIEKKKSTFRSLLKALLSVFPDWTNLCETGDNLSSFSSSFYFLKKKVSGCLHPLRHESSFATRTWLKRRRVLLTWLQANPSNSKLVTE